MPGPVLVLELNELCPPLMEQFIAEGMLPSFERLRDESRCFVTDAGEPAGRLNPWVQWVTVHTGVGLDEHGALRLGEGRSVTQPTLGDLVSEAGRPVWLCSPMNVVPRSTVRGAYLPDAWTVDAHATPRELEAFHRFVRASVQEHSNPSARMSFRDQARFVWFLARHGLRSSTVMATVQQLRDERRSPVRWRRAALLDRFQWDVFRWFLKRERPALATFFSNSTAHLQHHYWRYHEPEAFDPAPSREELAAHGDPVRYGYEQMDRMVGEALDLVGDDGTLVLCTALSQQAYRREGVAGKGAFHRPHRLDDVADLVGLAGKAVVAPVMAEQFHLLFREEADARTAEDRLASARVGDEPAFEVRRTGCDVFTGCRLFGVVSPDAVLTIPDLDVSLPFASVFYASETGQSGMHHPDGLFWVRPPGGGAAFGGDPPRVPLEAVAPTLLALLEVEPPPHMAAALSVLEPPAHAP